MESRRRRATPHIISTEATQDHRIYTSSRGWSWVQQLLSFRHSLRFLVFSQEVVLSGLAILFVHWAGHFLLQYNAHEHERAWHLRERWLLTCSNSIDDKELDILCTERLVWSHYGYSGTIALFAATRCMDDLHTITLWPLALPGRFYRAIFGNCGTFCDYWVMHMSSEVGQLLSRAMQVSAFLLTVFSGVLAMKWIVWIYLHSKMAATTSFTAYPAHRDAAECTRADRLRVGHNPNVVPTPSSHAQIDLVGPDCTTRTPEPPPLPEDANYNPGYTGHPNLYKYEHQNKNPQAKCDAHQWSGSSGPTPSHQESYHFTDVDLGSYWAVPDDMQV